MGPVTNVVLFDKEPEGVASVRYGNAEAAIACVNVCCLPLCYLQGSFSRILGSHPLMKFTGNERSSLLRNDRRGLYR